jgi:hypothetical protein
MARITGLNCATRKTKGTAIPDCAYKFGWWKAFIFVPKGFRATSADLLAFKLFLQGKALNDTYANRVHIIKTFHTVERLYGERKSVTLGDGTTRQTNDATAGWRAQFDNGGNCYQMAVQSFSGKEGSFDLLIVDHNNTIIGTEYFNEATNEYELKGLTLAEIYVPIPEIGTPDDINRNIIEVVLQSAREELFTSPWVVNNDWNVLDEIEGINDVFLEILSTTGADQEVIDVVPTSGCGGINLAETFGASLANIARWVARNRETGAAITIVSATLAATGQSYIVTLDPVDPDYPVADGHIDLRLAAPSVLSLAGVEWYETPEAAGYVVL